MGFKRVVQLILTVILLGGAILFGMSGVYHEAPWIVAPAIGSAKIELGGQIITGRSAFFKACFLVMTRCGTPFAFAVVM